MAQTRTMKEVDELAREADISRMTAVRYFAGLPVRGPQLRRIQAALKRRPGRPSNRAAA